MKKPSAMLLVRIVAPVTDIGLYALTSNRICVNTEQLHVKTSPSRKHDHHGGGAGKGYRVENVGYLAHDVVGTTALGAMEK